MHSDVNQFWLQNEVATAVDLEKLKMGKFVYGNLVLGSNQFLLLPQMPLKMMLASKKLNQLAFIG